MTADPAYYEGVLHEAGIEPESCTIVLVSQADRGLLARALGADLTRTTGDPDPDDIDSSACALADVTGGALGYEPTGFADPANDVLRLLSADGGRAAVARSNIQGHLRFGCAVDGELVFDDDEFIYIDDRSRIPEALTHLFAQAWIDLDDEVTDEDDGPGPLSVALAMAEAFTGVSFTAQDLERATEAGWFRVPSLTYAG